MTNTNKTSKTKAVLLACGIALLGSNIFIIRGRRNMAAKEVAR